MRLGWAGLAHCPRRVSVLHVELRTTQQPTQLASECWLGCEEERRQQHKQWSHPNRARRVNLRLRALRWLVAHPNHPHTRACVASESNESEDRR